jgi:anaerobic selenocysteine-containing dehydrogenase
VLELPPDRPDEWEILLTLAAIVLGQDAPVDVGAADAFVLRQVVDAVVADDQARVADRDPEAVLAALGDQPGPERMLDLLLRAGPYGEGFGTDPEGLSLARLRAEPHGIDLGELRPRLPEVLRTESGLVELAPPVLTEHVPALEAELGDRRPEGLVLIGRRHLRTNNSWSHNVPELAKGQQLCTLQMHPADAGSRGLEEGSLARVSSAAGHLEAVVECVEDLRPGVVSLPHGFGHDLDGVELEVARRQSGVNSNVLTDRRDLDPVSGTAVLNGIPVEVVSA